MGLKNIMDVVWLELSDSALFLLITLITICHATCFLTDLFIVCTPSILNSARHIVGTVVGAVLCHSDSSSGVKTTAKR